VIRRLWSASIPDDSDYFGQDDAGEESRGQGKCHHARSSHGRFAGPGTSGPAKAGAVMRRTGKCRSPPVTGAQQALPRRYRRKQFGLT
jgi:hypothetical protein